MNHFNLDKKTWNNILDKYLTTGHLLSEEYEILDIEYKFVIQEIKKSLKRINKPMINEIHHSIKDEQNNNNN